MFLISQRPPLDEDMRALTNRQKEVLSVIKAQILTTGVPPTRRELATKLGLKAGPSVEGHLRALERRGLIELVPDTQRGIKLAQTGGLPLMETVYARAEDEPLFDDKRVFDRMPELIAGAYARRPTFFFKLGTQGMGIRGLGEGEIVAVYVTDQAHDDNIVIVRLDGQILCRIFRRLDRRHVRLSVTTSRGMVHETIDETERAFQIEGIVLGAVIGLTDWQILRDTKL